MSETKDEFTELVLGSGVLLSGQIVGKILALGGHVLLVRLLDPHLFGRLSLAHTVILIFSPFVMLGIPNGITRMIAASDTQRTKSDMAIGGGVIMVITGCLVSICLIYFRGFAAEVVNATQAAPLLVWFAPLLVLKPIGQTTLSIVRTYGESGKAAVMRDITPKVAAIVSLLLVSAIATPYQGAIAYWLVGAITMILTGTYFVNSLVGLPTLFSRIPDRNNLARLVSHSWPLAIEGGFMLLMTRFDLLAIGYFLSETEVGYYRSVQPLAVATLFILNSFVFLYLPLATEYFEDDRLEDIQYLYTRTTKWVVVSTLPLLIVFGVFPNDVIRVFLSNAYSPAALPFAVLLLGMFARVVVGPNGATIKAINKTRVNLLSSSVGVITNICLNIVLIPQYQMVGAATATALGYLIYNGTEVIVLYSLHRIQPFSLDLVKLLLVLAGITVLMQWRFTGTYGLIELIGIGIALATLTLVLSLATGTIKISEVQDLLDSSR
ncbi:flippase [Halosimplex pelagicum]|uniref:Flippase n=1 Tax=Halosimplex pelagicum TaxID=869886 RepID=A0A7D5TRG3_9EURY|nr:flippase [Halosimplex pelagicum]QLH81272.1 flippase [Halosimplex pelagicum]